MSDRSSYPSAGSSDADVIAALKAQVEAQQAFIRQQAETLAHSRKIFDRSSAAARIGVWECTLADQSLVWTDVVYDIFDLPRGSALDRNEILKCYPAETVGELHKRRSQAIEDRTGFSLDTEIVTHLGNRRWMRITATVESVDGVAVRIFGMKQDITEEKIMADRNRYLAEFDIMTGLANRSRFQSRLAVLDTTPRCTKPFSALLLIDLDEFKPVNDRFGHAAGDACLREAAQRIQNVCVGAELVARLGGDEFAVLMRPDLQLADISEAARAIVTQISHPMEHGGQSLQIGASVGIALLDACSSSELFMMADTALYHAKDAGRGTFRIYKRGTTRRLQDQSAA